MDKINTILLDDHKIFAELLAESLNADDKFLAKVFFMARDLYCFLENNVNTDILILDMDLEDTTGFQVIDHVKSNYPKIKILVLSAEIDSNTVKTVLKKKVDGFISKSQDVRTIKKAIKTVYDGNIFICSKTKEIIQSDNVSPFYIDITKLTKREKQILFLIGNGYDTCAIAENLNLSEETIKTHRKNIRNKLSFHSFNDLIKFSVENKKYLK